MKNFKKILVLVIMVMASVISFTACGNPYKGMSLELDDGGFENALERSYKYAGEDLSISISASVLGAGKGVSTDVVYTIQDKNLISAGEKTVEGLKTTQEFLIKGTGETYITVSSAEGNLRKDIKIKSYAPATALNFASTTIPLVQGQTVDITKVSAGLSKALLTFEPAYATEKDVELKATNGGRGIASSSVLIEGNNITVSNSYESDFTLVATLKGTSISKSVRVHVLKPISASEVMLGYTSTYEDSQMEGGKLSEIKPIDKSLESGIDYQLYLADQSAGDQIRDARSIYLIREYNGNYNVNQEYSFSLKSSNGKNTVITSAINSGFSITNGNGVDNSDLYYFNINYLGYEEFFSGITVCVKVTISTFPTDVVINTNTDITNISKQDSIYVFNNYQNMAGTAFYVKLCNVGGFISNQYAYVNVWDISTGTNATLGGFAIYDQNGERVVPGITKVKSGTRLSIRYDSSVITTVNDNYVLYAISAIDSNITTLKTNNEGAYEYNHIKLVKDYTLSGLTDVTLELNSGTEKVKLPIDTATANLPYEIFDVEVGGLVNVGLVTDQADPDDNGYFIASKTGELGQSYYTVVAPNGQTAVRNIFVTKAVSEATVFELKVGGYVITPNGTIGINMDISKSYNVSLLIDGVEYKTLPPKYKITLEHKSGTACTYEGWQKIKSLKTPTIDTADQFVFTMTYTTKVDGKETEVPVVFTLNVQVVKPIKAITPSNSRVNLLSDDIKNIDVVEVDKNNYLDISGMSSKTISYVLNPTDASINTIKTENGTYLLDLNTATFTFEYGTDYPTISSIGEPYSEHDGYYAGSYVSYNGNRYVYDWARDEWYLLSDSGATTLVDEVDIIRALVESEFTFRYYMPATPGTGDSAVNITFNWRATAQNNKIVLDVKNVVSSNIGANGESFVLRLAYMQEYIASPKTYYIRRNATTLNWELTETDEDNAPAISYIAGAFKITQDCFITVGDTLVAIEIAGIRNEVEFNGVTGSFEYTKYAIRVGASTIFNISKPVKTNSITVIGANKSTENNGYEVALNGNQIHNGDMFGYSYLASNTSNKPLEKSGLIITSFRTGIEGLQETILSQNIYISCLDYDINDKLVGVKSNALWEIATGLSFYIDFETQRIDFTIKDVTKFTDYLRRGEYVKTLYITSLDTVMDDAKTTIAFTIKLRTGTNTNPYEIYDATTLQNVNLALDENTYYVVKNDISLQGVSTWVPIGTSSSNSFRAHIITDNNKKFNVFGFNGTLSPIGSGEYEGQMFPYLGVFGYIGTKAQIENLTFKNNRLNIVLDNNYQMGELYIGTIAGYIATGARLNNIKVVDSETVNYNNYGGLKNIAAENFTRGITLTNVDNVVSLNIYVGGVAGFMGTSMSGVTVYQTINIADTYDSHIMYVGGAFGKLEAGAVVSGEFATILKTTNRVTQSSLGGVAGWSKGSISNSTVVTYIYSNGGYNLGGVFGRFEDDYTKYYATDALKNDKSLGAYINNVEVTPMIFGAGKAQYVGGVVGTMQGIYSQISGSGAVQEIFVSDTEKHYIANVKVKFTDRGCENSIFNSSVVGYNFVGGMIGRLQEGVIGISYSSVFSYVNREINMGYSESSDASGYYYGDIIANASLTGSAVYVGGLIGGHDDITASGYIRQIYEKNEIYVSSVYYDANIRVLGGAKVGGVIGNFIGRDYKITDTTLTGRIYYTQNYSYEGLEKPVTSYVGNFIGSISNIILTNNDKYYDNNHKLITKFTSVDAKLFNIVNSYSLIKAKDLSATDELAYINNFVGDGATYASINTDGTISSIALDYLTIEIRYFGGDDFDVSYYTVDDNNSGTQRITAKKENDIYIVPLGGIPTYGVNSTMGTRHANDVWQVNIPTSNVTSGSTAIVKREIFQIKASVRLNAVWALNSFYMGFKTNMFVDAGLSTNYTFNETDLVKSVGAVDEAGYFVNTIDTTVKGIKYSFNYFNNFGFDNFIQPNYGSSGTIKFAQGENNAFLGAEGKGWTLQEGEMFGSNAPCTNNLHMTKYTKTYIYEGVESGVLNNTDDKLDTFTKYQNRELLDGNAIALKKDKMVEGKPNLVVSVAPDDIIVEVSNEYVANSSEKTIAILKVSDEVVRLKSLVNITPIPAMASDEVIYSSSDENVMTVSGNDLVLKDEGVATLTIISALNSRIQKQITIIVVYIDRNNLNWSLSNANGTGEYTEKDANGNLIIDIIANDGLTLTTLFEGKGTLTYGMEYIVDLTSVNTVDTTKKEAFLKNFTIGGKKLDQNKIQTVLAGGEISEDNRYDTIECSGLQHAVFCNVLGSIKVTQKLYFVYTVGGVEYKCYIFSKDATGKPQDSKDLKFNFNEGVFDISGSEELSFVVVNKSNFVVALNCDSNSFDVGFTAILGEQKVLINNIILGEEIILRDYSLGQLIVRLEAVDYDDANKLKVFKFSAYVDDEGQKAVNSDLNYTLQFFAKAGSTVYDNLTHDVHISISQQQVESLNITHYTNMLYTENTIPTNGVDSYKYSSNIIIPGYTSLLQVDFYPSFGFFDYVEVTTSSPLLNINQVVEALNMEGKSVDYSWYEVYTEHVVRLANGIRISNKYSTRDYSETLSAQLGYNGSLFIAMFADQALADKNVQITITGYKEGVQESLFTTTVSLGVEARPNININANANEVVFGGMIDLDIKVEYTTESFSASLKSTTSDAELIGSLADIVYNSSKNSYVLVVKDTRYTYINYSQYMYQDLVLKVTVSKVINGVLVTAEKSVNIRLVPFIIDSITVNLEGATQDNRNYIVSYYQAYNMVIKLNTTYSQGYYSYLLSTDPTNSLNVQIANLEAYIAKNVKNYSMFGQGVEGNIKKLLTPNNSSYSGEIAVTYDDTYNTTSVRFISVNVSDFIWAEVGINYTSAGIDLVNVNLLPEYIFTYNFAVAIDTSSADDHPEPITSVNDLRNMKEGVSYILLKDLLLANWTPIDGNFKVFDGNGYVITILSFANITSSGEVTNVGIFKSISEGSIVKNLTIEVMPIANINFVEQDYESDEYSNKVNAQISEVISKSKPNEIFSNGLTVDISDLTNVNFGLLAGENRGTITNVNVIDNAIDLRTERDTLVRNISDSKRIDINYGDNFNTAINLLTKDPTDNAKKSVAEKKINIITKKENETTSKNDNIAVLVGSNEGFITNSSVERINISSQEYVGGLVGYNAKNAKISSSYFREGDIIHNVPVREGAGVGGFVARNAGIIAYSYVYGADANIASGSGYSVSGLHAGGKAVTTSGFAGGFVYENTGTITNSYSNIWVKGAGAGFAYKNETETSVIEYCYSLSSMRINDSTTYPFTNKNMASTGVLNKGTVKDCFYLYNSSYVNMSNDAGVSLEADDFSDYNAFVAYAFNADYNLNNEILDAVWYIPSVTKQNSSIKSGVQANPKTAPQLVSANLKTLSVRYLIQDQTEQYAFTYNYATPIGTVTNPMLIDSSETFNKSVLTNKTVGETRNFRIINDISYNIGDEISNTNNAIFKGKLDGNGMTLNNLRLSSTDVNTGDSVTKLGLFATIAGRKVEGVQEYAVVKNLNMNISQIDGINVNIVGVLAGEISDARIYNIVVEGKDIVVQGLNAVGGVAGIVYGDTDLVNLSSSVSVSANYFANYNPFDYTTSYTQQQGSFDSFVRKNTLYDVETNNISSVSYAGGIAGICNIIKRDPTSVSDIKLSSLYNNLYRARRLYLSGTPTISGEVVGGIFGYLAENANMSDCEITVSSGMHLKSTRIAGGLVGHNLGEIKRSTIENDNQASLDALINKNIKAYDNATSDITLGVEDMYGADSTEYRAMFAGGLVGFMQEGKLLNSYNRVTVNSKNSLYAGGIIGLSLGGTLLDSVYTTASVYSYVSYGGVFGYVTDKLGTYFFTSNLEDASPISLTNVVAGNIWKFSHLNISRKNELSPNAKDAAIGMLAGRVASDDSVDIFNREKASNLANRVNYEMVYYKQTYSYKALTGQSAMTIIQEIGNKPLNTSWFVKPTLNADGTSTNDGAYNGRYAYLDVYANKIDATNATPVGFGAINSSMNTATKFFVHPGTGLASGLYRSTNVEGNDESSKIYLFSRMSQYGSLRSLQEIIERRNSSNAADDFYAKIGYKDNKEKTITTGLEKNIYGFTKIENNTTYYYAQQGLGVSVVNIYENWEDLVWKGIRVNDDGTLIDSDCVFPALKNSLDTWTDVYVYSERDLMDLTTKNTSNFILMNDIYLSTNVGNFCSIDKPFKGTIRSAKVGDIDGGNVVQYNYKFTIFNLDYQADSATLNTNMALGGLVCASDGASFENFNIHVVRLGVRDDKSLTASSKTTAMGVLVGRANGLTTIKNVQILGFGEKAPAKANVTKTNWTNTTKLGEKDKTKLDLTYAWSANQYKKADGKSFFENADKKPATITGANFEFMGGYIGVASNVDATISDGSVYKLTGEVRIINDSNYPDEKSAMVQEVGGGIIITNDSHNEYISKCQVKNLTFNNKYYGTRIGTDDSVSVVSYIGGYFGLANLLDSGTANSEHEAIDFEAYNIAINYDLDVNNQISSGTGGFDNSIDKIRYDETTVDRGIYLGSIAGQIKSVEPILVNYAITQNTNIKITKSLSSDSVMYMAGSVYAGSFGKLSDQMQINHVIVDGFNVIYNNGDSANNRQGFTASSNIAGATLTADEYIGGFAGYSGSAVTFNKTTSDAIEHENEYIGQDYTRFDKYDIAVSDVILTIKQDITNDSFVDNTSKLYIGGVAGYMAEDGVSSNAGSPNTGNSELNMIVATFAVRDMYARNVYLGGAIGKLSSTYDASTETVYSIKVLGVDVSGTILCGNTTQTCVVGGVIGDNGFVKNKETLAEGTINLTGETAGKYCVGGLYGCVSLNKGFKDNIYDVTSLVDIFITVKDVGDGVYAGGILGIYSGREAGDGMFNKAYSYSNVFVSFESGFNSSAYAGGLAGGIWQTSTFNNSIMFGTKKITGLNVVAKKSQTYRTPASSNMYGTVFRGSLSFSSLSNNYYNYSMSSMYNFSMSSMYSSNELIAKAEMIQDMNSDNSDSRSLIRYGTTNGLKYQEYVGKFYNSSTTILKDDKGQYKYLILNEGSKINPIANDSTNISKIKYKSVYINVDGNLNNVHDGITIYDNLMHSINNPIELSNSVVYNAVINSLTANNSFILDTTVNTSYTANNNTLFISGTLGNSVNPISAFNNNDSIIAFSKINLSSGCIKLFDSTDYYNKSLIDESELNVYGAYSFSTDKNYIHKTMRNSTFKWYVDNKKSYKYIIKAGNPLIEMSSSTMWEYDDTATIISRNEIMKNIDFTTKYVIIDNEAYARMVYGNWRVDALIGGNKGDIYKRFASKYVSNSGSGTSQYYTITNEKEFVYAINEINRLASHGSITIEINTTSLDFSGKILDQISLKEYQTVTIKGHNKGTIIKGLNITTTSYGGLFKEIPTNANVSISKLRIIDSYVYGKQNTGTLVGYQKAGSVLSISKVAIENTSVYSGSSYYVGSFIGQKECYQNDPSLISNSYSVTDQPYTYQRSDVNIRKINEYYYYALIGRSINSALTYQKYFINNDINCVYAGIFDYNTKELITGFNINYDEYPTIYHITKQFAVFGFNDSSWNLLDASSSFSESRVSIKKDQLVKYQGETGRTNFENAGFKFNVTDGTPGHWEVNSSTSVNYGLPKIHFEALYWCDLTEEVVPSGNEYLVKNAKQLAWIALQTNTGKNTFDGKTVKLANDIDLQEAIWVPMGGKAGTYYFGGTFDGDGHTIRNMYSEGYFESSGTNGDTHFAGFMNKVLGTIKNVKFNNVELNAQNVAVVAGSLIGCRIDGVEIKNAKLKFTVNAGGIALDIQTSTIFNSLISGATLENRSTTADGFVGGIVSRASSSNKIIACCVEGLDFKCSSTNTTSGLIAGHASDSLIQNNAIKLKDGATYGSGTFAFTIGKYGTGLKLFETQILFSASGEEHTSDGTGIKYKLIGSGDTNAVADLKFENLNIVTSKASQLTEDNIKSFVKYSETGSSCAVKGFLITNNGVGGATTNCQDSYWISSSASKYLSGIYNQMYDYYGDELFKATLFKSNWGMPVANEDKINLSDNAITPSTENVTVKTHDGHNYIADYASFRYSNNRIFNIHYNLSSNVVGEYNIIGVYPFEFGDITGGKTINITAGTHIFTNRSVLSDKNGLFGNIYYANISGINVKISGGDTAYDVGNHSGAIADRAEHVKFENCSVAFDNTQVVITSKESTAYLGGMIGYGRNVDVNNCNVTGLNISVVSDSTFAGVGGVVGYINSGFANSTTGLTKVEFSGTIDATGNANVGGIVGNALNITVVECKNTSGMIVGKGNVGGIAGHAYITYFGDATEAGSAERGNTNLAKIVGGAKIGKEIYGNVGGIVGLAEDCVRINYSTNGENGKDSAEIIGLANAGGIIGRLYNKDYKVSIQNNTNYAPINSSIEITSGYMNVGGLIGIIDGSNGSDKNYIRRILYNKVLNNVNGYENVGGLVGYETANSVYLGGNEIGNMTGNKIYVSGYKSVAGFVGRYFYVTQLFGDPIAPLVFEGNKFKNVDILGYDDIFLLTDTSNGSGVMSKKHINFLNDKGEPINGITNKGIDVSYFENWHIISIKNKFNWALFNSAERIWGITTQWKDYINVGADKIYNLYGEYSNSGSEKYTMNAGNYAYENAGSVKVVKFDYASNGKFNFSMYDTSDGSGTPSKTFAVENLEFNTYTGETITRRVSSFTIDGNEFRQVKLKSLLNAQIKPGYYYGLSYGRTFDKSTVIYVLANGNIVFKENQSNSDSRNNPYYESYTRLSLLEPYSYDNNTWTYKVKYGNIIHGSECYDYNNSYYFKFTYNEKDNNITYSRIVRCGPKKSNTITKTYTEEFILRPQDAETYTDYQLTGILDNTSGRALITTMGDGCIRFNNVGDGKYLYYYRVLSTKYVVYYASMQGSEEFIEVSINNMTVNRFFETEYRFDDGPYNKEQFTRIIVGGL